MERHIYQKLIAWKSSPGRKPLLLMGARQTGKTWILKEFGRREYANLVYCNFEEEPLLDDFFTASLKPKNILEKLTVREGREIRPGETLILFDEIQQSNAALNSLKYFAEENPEYHVAAAGSLLGVKLSGPRSFPVGKVSFLTLHPMTFSEFLSAMGESRYRGLLEEIGAIAPIPALFHEELIGLLKTYYVVGGMPEAVATYVSTRSFESTRTVHSAVLKAYTLDFAKHAPAVDIPKLSLVWDSIPLHLAKENKKFVFSMVAQSARARDYDNALQWLTDAGLIQKAYAVDHVEQPVRGFADRSAFKVYALDVGLLGAMSRIAPSILLNGNEIFQTYNGAFVENFVAQHLAAAGGEGPCDLYYWKKNPGIAEIDFLTELEGEILPLEVKAGVNSKSKSLGVYAQRYAPRILLRSTLLNLKLDGQILNIPLYAIEHLGRLAHPAMKKNEFDRGG
jgi:predicted AAA+ superfamily ATPase